MVLILKCFQFFMYLVMSITILEPYLLLKTVTWLKLLTLLLAILIGAANCARHCKFTIILYRYIYDPWWLSTHAGMARDWPDARGIFHNQDKNFLVWVNEEDHSRVISMQNDGNMKEVGRLGLFRFYLFYNFLSSLELVCLVWFNVPTDSAANCVLRRVINNFDAV